MVPTEGAPQLGKESKAEGGLFSKGRERMGIIKTGLIMAGEGLVRGAIKTGAVVGRLIKKGAVIAGKAAEAVLSVDDLAKRGYEKAKGTIQEKIEAGKGWLQEKKELAQGLLTGKGAAVEAVKAFKENRTPENLQTAQETVTAQRNRLMEYGTKAVNSGRLGIIEAMRGYRFNMRPILLRRLAFLANMEANDTARSGYFRELRQRTTRRLGVLDALEGVDSTNELALAA